MSPGLLRPHWPPTAGIEAAFTWRGGGASAAPWHSLNLGDHVGDDPAAVTENRRRVAAGLALPCEPLWLRQEHGLRVADADREREPAPADAATSAERGRVLAILVADCMPVLFASDDGTAIGAAHAGWRGLAGGVLEATVAALRERAGVPAPALQAWLGPAIGPAAFEVGDEVRAAFVAHDPGAAAAFAGNARGRWQCDLGRLARQRLAALGIARVGSAGVCTHSDAARCFSYRRDGQTGRMAALIWRT